MASRPTPTSTPTPPKCCCAREHRSARPLAGTGCDRRRDIYVTEPDILQPASEPQTPRKDSPEASRPRHWPSSWGQCRVQNYQLFGHHSSLIRLIGGLFVFSRASRRGRLRLWLGLSRALHRGSPSCARYRHPGISDRSPQSAPRHPPRGVRE